VHILLKTGSSIFRNYGCLADYIIDPHSYIQFRKAVNDNTAPWQQQAKKWLFLSLIIALFLAYVYVNIK